MRPCIWSWIDSPHPKMILFASETSVNCLFAALGEITAQGLEKIKMLVHSALFTVLRQEIDRFNQLLVIIHKSLKDLCLAVKGEVVMSQSLEDAYSAFLNQRVPPEWRVSMLNCLLRF